MADVDVALHWTGSGLVFEGGAAGGATVVVDGDKERGASPMQLLLLSVAGCSAADVVEILGKMRVPLQALTVRVEGERAAEPPRRYLGVRITYVTRGITEADEPKLRRAIALSKETYCSVLHTLQADLEVSTAVELG